MIASNWQLFSLLESFEEALWSFIGVPLIVGFGLYLTWQSGFIQVLKFSKVFRIFTDYLKVRELDRGAVHPLKAFFAAVGGCVGIGNIVAVCTAVQLGGPGALLWLWITALIGVMLKYGEVYLGIKYRIPDGKGSYDGGPMYFLRRAFKGRWASIAVAVLLCLYGVEIYQFNVITTSTSANFGISEWFTIVALLGLVLFAGSGGVRRVGAISSAIVPLFVVLYAGMGIWVLANNLALVPGLLKDVFVYAFTPHAAVGGFAGSVVMLTISQGVRRGCYTGDLGIGYASVIYSESSEQDFAKQASLVLFGIIVDTFIVCTTSIMLILVTDVWTRPMDASMLVQTALSEYFPYMNYFMPFFLFLLGYSTINAYFVVGLKCAHYLSPKWGKSVYYVYAVAALIIFSFVDQTQAQSVMMIVAGLLLILNSWGIWRLRHEISYDV